MGRPRFLPTLEAWIEVVKDSTLIRGEKKAQKQVLEEWRDRKQFPGLAARFDAQGQKQYDFSERQPGYSRRNVPQGGYDPNRGLVRKGDLPDYVYTGKFRTVISKRKVRQPRGSKKSGDVRSVLKFGGSVLNALKNQHGWREVTSTKEVRTFTRKAHTRTTKTGKTVSVSAHQVTATKVVNTGSHSAKSYAEEFDMRPADKKWIEKRTETVRELILRKMIFSKTGRIKKSALKAGVKPFI